MERVSKKKSIQIDDKLNLRFHAKTNYAKVDLCSTDPVTDAIPTNTSNNNNK